MNYKSAIRKAITQNTKYVAIKVYKPEYHEYSAGRDIITIEVEVRKKTHSQLVKNKPSTNTFCYGLSNDIVDFCRFFAKNYLLLPEGRYESICGNIILKREMDKKSDTARVNHLTHEVEINSNLKIGKSAILFLLIWCYVAMDNQKEDNIPVRYIEIDQKTMDILIKIPEFSPKEAISYLTTVFGDRVNSDYLKRMKNLIK
jgi:hypothetical protein